MKMKQVESFTLQDLFQFIDDMLSDCNMRNRSVAEDWRASSHSYDVRCACAVLAAVQVRGDYADRIAFFPKPHGSIVNVFGDASQ